MSNFNPEDRFNPEDSQEYSARTKFILDDEWINLNSLELDWFSTVREYADFFAHTLNRWLMPTDTLQALNETVVVCMDEGILIKIVNASVIRVELYSNGKHINSMVMEILDCLCIQATSATELTEDQAYELRTQSILKDMNEYQVQRYTDDLGRRPRDEVDEWKLEHTGLCENLKRVSYGTFTDAVINVRLMNLDNVCGATFTNCVFASSCSIEKVMFVECVFDNVVFDCTLSKVGFDGCVLKQVSWPTADRVRIEM